MEQTAKTKTIKIVCIVLAIAIVVAGIITGIVAFFNSNLYRFRMSAFTGEYLNVEKETGREVGTFTLKDKKGNKLYSSIPTYYDESLRLLDHDLKTEFPLDKIDPKVVSELEHYAKMFAGKCIVNKDNFTFPQTSQMLNITKSVYEKETLQSSPQRIINLKDGKTTANITCVFVTDYFSKYENLFLVEYKQFDIMVKDTITTDDGNQYSFEFYVLFYLGEEYIDKYK